MGRLILCALWLYSANASAQAFETGTEIDLEFTSPGSEDLAMFPAVAENRDSYLIAYEDRHGRCCDRYIYTVRMDSAGRFLERRLLGQGLGSPRTDALRPAAASNGSSFLVAWLDRAAGVSFTRMAGDGTVLDPGGRSVTCTGSSPSVASNGTDYLVAWVDGGIKAARIRALDGTVLGGAPIRISLDGESPSVAFDGTDYFVVWQGATQVEAARVRVDGTLRDAAPFTVAEYPTGPPTVGCLSGTCLVAWRKDLIVSDRFIPTVRATRVDRSSRVLDPSWLDISGAERAAFSHVADDGTRFIVTWRESSATSHHMMGTAVELDGTVRAPTTIANANAWQPCSVRRLGSAGYLAVWEASHTGPNIYARFVDGAGAVDGPPLAASTPMAGYQGYAGVGFDGAQYLVAWVEDEGGLAARVDTSGRVTSTSPVRFGAAGSMGPPRLTRSGTGMLAAWTADQVYGARFSTTGALLGSGFELLVPYSDCGGSSRFYTLYPIRAAFDGTNHFLTWQYESCDGWWFGQMIRVRPDGTVLDPTPHELDAVSHEIQTPDVSCGPTSCLAVWGVLDQVLATRVAADGSARDDPPIVVTGSRPSSYMVPVRVAFDGTGYLVLWGNPAHLEASRVTEAGVVLDTPPIDVGDACARPLDLDLAFDGREYVATWSDRVATRSGEAEVYGVTVGTDGAVGAVDRLAHGRDPTIASDGSGWSVLAYTRFDEDTSFLADRVKLRLIRPASGTAAGCVPRPDGGVVFTCTSDGGVMDGGVMDGGAGTDGGVMMDASNGADAGELTDGGTAMDAAAPMDSSGGHDAEADTMMVAPDSSVPHDGDGMGDASTGLDAAPGRPSGGGGCATVHGGDGRAPSGRLALWALGMLLPFLRRRRLRS